MSHTTDTLSEFSGAELVAVYRKSAARARTIERNLRLGVYNGRNSGITQDVLESARRIRHAVEAELVRRSNAASGPEAERDSKAARVLAGLLVAEHNLSARISESRDNGVDRPELRERLNDARRGIRLAHDLRVVGARNVDSATHLLASALRRDEAR